MSVVNATQLASMFGVHRSTISQWQADGMPVLKRSSKGGKGGGNQFDTADVLDWYKKRAIKSATGSDDDQLPIEEVRRRKIAAEAELQELELAKKKGEVIELSEVKRDLIDKMVNLRSAMRKVPERCVLRVVGEEDETKVKEIILSEVDDALERTIGGE
jgi:terminase small subunit / prophage DNA-packing protein